MKALHTRAALNLRQMRAEGVRCEDVRRCHDAVVSLQQGTKAVLAAAKHEADRARKAAKSSREMRDALAKCWGDAGAAATGASNVFVAAGDASAIQETLWDTFAVELDRLVSIAREELSQLFLEASTLYSSYLGVCNELASKQGKERRAVSMVGLGMRSAEKESDAHRAVLELTLRKDNTEACVQTRLAELLSEGHEMLSFLLKRHEALQVCLLVLSLQVKQKDALRKEAEGWSAWREASVAAWQGLTEKLEATRAAAATKLASLPTGGSSEDLAAMVRGIGLKSRGWSNRSFAQVLRATQKSSDTSERSLGGLMPEHSVPLSELATAEGAVDGVPVAAHLLMRQLRSPSPDDPQRLVMQVDGIFRLSAEASDVDVLRLQLEGNSPTESVSRCYDAHVLATCLKKFYCRLPEPLLPTEVYDRLVDIGNCLTGDEGERDDGKDTAATLQLKQLLALLPRVNVTNVLELFTFLSEVAKLESTTRMSAWNLALVFVPNVVRAGADLPAESELADMNPIAKALCLIIQRPKEMLSLAVSEGSDDSDGDAPLRLPSPLEPTRSESSAVSAPDRGRAAPVNWWYLQAGQQMGPVPASQLVSLLDTGTISTASYVYCEGALEWTPLAQVQQLLSLP
uniref:Rho-GAP domain-containing protein n=1 Tax=Chrysotila carterae TaxID=13221 RepID=A0A7S4BAY5_CHRCT